MISLLCPTRKRPHNLKRLVKSILDTIDTSYCVSLHCYVDEDDDSYLPCEEFKNIHFIRGPRITMSCLWDALIPHTQGDLLMMLGDDVIFRTPGWNKMVEREFAKCADKILLVHGDDLSEFGKQFATLPIIHRRWYEITGHFAGLGFSSCYADTWPNDVADMIGRRRFLPYVTEHVHPVWGKAKMDETYRETEEREKRDDNGKRYLERLPERIADAEKLRREMRP